MDISIDDIRKLPPQTQLELAEQIYDGLLHTGDLPTDEQMTEVRRRAKEMEDNPSIGLTEDQMWARVDDLRNDRKS